MTLRLSADAPALAHGLGLFETMRVVRGHVVQVDQHLQRMIASSGALSFPLPDEDAFRGAVNEAAQGVSTLGEAALRCMYLATSAKKWRLVATAHAMPEATLLRRRRGRAVTLTSSRALPEHKLTSYAASILGLREAQAKGADEGLFVDRRGRVLEGTATNVFAISGRRLITAPVRDGILPGIVRAWVIENASRVDLDVAERAPTKDELREGSFFTSSLTMLAPVRKLDGDVCRAPGDAFEELQRLYRRVP